MLSRLPKDYVYVRVDLLSPYDAVSHRYWRTQLVQGLPDFEFTTWTMAPRYFNWRVRGNALQLSSLLNAEKRPKPDLILATSMTDLATLKGLVPSYNSIPSLVYFHENQFAFPAKEPDAHRIAAQITSIYTALAADRVVFNSVFNQDTFFSGARALLARMPDAVPKGFFDQVRSSTKVLPVPLAESTKSPQIPRNARRGIIWNHRWEHDKGPEQLYAIVAAYVDRGGSGPFHLLGQQFRVVPEAMSASIKLLRSHGLLGHVGFIEDRLKYFALLGKSRYVLSTAHHEFQGLAVQEAMAEGCTPVVPDALVYPEYVPATSRYQSPEEAAELLVTDAPENPSMLVERYTWQRQAVLWRQLLHESQSPVTL
ncbi:MAG: DUF3524 domain-containing protein [Pseudomonadales bacterium]|nr:DUF3524 domain-containing protein [Pseudomonadales bacterium]